MNRTNFRNGPLSRWKLALLALAWLAALLGGGASSPLDQQMLSALYLGEGSASAPLWIGITELGGWKVLTPLAIAAGVFLLVKRRMRDAAFLAATVIGTRALVELQKVAFARARPEDMHLAEVYSQAFPSGHAANALATYLALSLVLFGNRIAVAAALLLAFLIGLSRPLLGVHWPSDVIGGWAFGLFCTLAFARLMYRTAHVRPAA